MRNANRYEKQENNHTHTRRVVRPVTVPLAVKDDPDLHALLALVDGIRIGRTRERKIAVDELSKRLRPSK